MALNFDPTKKIKKIKTDSKIFEDPLKNENITTIKREYNTEDNENVSTIKREYENNNGNVSTIKREYNTEDNENVSTIKREYENGPNELAGNQLKLFNYIIENIRMNNGQETTALNYERLATILERTTLQIKSSIQELLKKDLIKITYRKDGRAGFCRYSVKPENYKEYISTKTINENITGMYQPYNDHENGNKQALSKKESKINVLITEYPNIQKIGLKIEHLQKTERTEEDLIQLLTHFEHSLMMNEIKSPQKLPIILSIINDQTKTWVSESYLQQLNQELDANQKRVEALEKLKKQNLDIKLREKYQNFISENPNFKSEVLEKQPFKNLNDEVLEKICFEEFKEKFAQNLG